MASKLKVITDNQWKPFKYGHEVPARVRNRDFDYLDDAEAMDGFFKYRRQWYHTSEFERAPASLKGWDGYAGDSYFSGVVLKISRDGEQYKVGTALVVEDNPRRRKARRR